MQLDWYKSRVTKPTISNSEISELSLRKQDHLTMAQASQTQARQRDQRFTYEPLLSAHPGGEIPPLTFAGHTFHFPLWVSSMTGGTKMARTINSNMARACAEFNLGMGLGSCRPLLNQRQDFADFDVRALMPGRPLYANLGVAQVAELQHARRTDSIHRMVSDLKADGLIIHVNPLQEWYQPGGDKFLAPPIETIASFLESSPYPVMVKEVGHGMGPESLRALMRLPLMAIEFASFGGTNFSVLEARRAGDANPAGLSHVGHTAEEMVGFVRQILTRDAGVRCRQFIISGGIQDVLQGHYLTAQLSGMALFGMAGALLPHAQNDYEQLRTWIQGRINEYAMARAYLRAKPLAEENV